ARSRGDATSDRLDSAVNPRGRAPRRADLAVSGAILLDTILRRLNADEISLCDLSLREGLILDYIAKHRKEIAQADRYPDVRRRSVIELAERCSYWPDHAHHISRLALALFDRTRAIHGMTEKDQRCRNTPPTLPNGAANTTTERPPRHSYYLIKNGDLRGFEPQEVETIALVARYHRRTPPSRHHADFRKLGRKRRKVV